MALNIFNQNKLVITLKWRYLLLIVLLIGLYHHYSFNKIQNRYNRLTEYVTTVKTTQTAPLLLLGIDTGLTQQVAVQGTGTFIAKHYVLTANHVMGDSLIGTIEIQGKSYDAIVINNDLVLDASILYVPELEGTVATLGKSANLEVGDELFIVGTPLGLPYTLGVGFMTAPIRSPIEGMIETIQYWGQSFHGNSGGGVFNSDDELVGFVDYYYVINTFDFAVPIDSLKNFIKLSLDTHKKLLNLK